MNYRTIEDMTRIIRTMPIPKVDAIAGIPRSGMLAASILALRHNLPLTDLNTLQRHRVYTGGSRGPSYPNLRSALVVDDSVLSGRAMNRAKTMLSHSTLKLFYAGIFVAPKAAHKVDLYGEVLERPRVFEWSILHHRILKKSCVDIDGVLCVDPTRAQNDDGPCYRTFLETAPPLYLPTVPIGYLVTSRLEKYRTLTTRWLDQHGVRYHKLIMFDGPTAASRRGRASQYKAEAYQATGARLFVESSLAQSRKIAALTHKAVFCTETWQMY